MAHPTRIEMPLKRILDSEGRKQTWLARQLSKELGRNITSNQVNAWCWGQHVPEHDKQQAIDRVLGQKVDWTRSESNLDQAA